MKNEEIKEILEKQLKLLSEQSQEMAKSGNTSLIPILTHAMCEVLQQLMTIEQQSSYQASISK